ncbi:membrane protein YqaA with SNARE-associated domain [Desulfobotulus alkaliphilus]|uniref:Membrane protein YqaA with SNARE-associated domain n=1 Tax=Desulfobotulus alkaliphilus TaxID=622671 RepID=A0A562RQ25_9BACT|nr:YqaA family protein [Desulfobotulus alkaliphilus]TWI71112.1 membrane protein YqaA with SNARE-associated domain [Desulfobotulus alkaliphilus]
MSVFFPWETHLLSSDEFWLMGLFLSAFVAATLLPGASEVVLVAALLNGKDPVAAVLAATTGNVLGAVTTFYLGNFAGERAGRFLGISEEKKQLSARWISRYGSWLLLFSWVPVVGDPLVFAAGILRMRVLLFLIFMVFGKLLRYILVAWLTIGAGLLYG